MRNQNKPMNPGISTLETEKTKSLKPSLNWGQGLFTKSQQQTNLSLPSPVVSTEQPVEFPNSTETERSNKSRFTHAEEMRNQNNKTPHWRSGKSAHS